MFLKVHGKKLRGRKSISIKTPIEDVLSPNFVYFPLEINGIKYRRVAEIGSYVKKGQVLLQRDDRYAHPVCSSVSGTVTEVKKMWNCLGKQVEMLEVQNDFKEEQCYIPSSEFNLTKEEIVSKVRNAGIVGLGGAGFPTYIKYLPKQKAELIIINAAECEPYITCDFISIIENYEKMIRGLKYIMKVNGAKKAVIAIKKAKVEAVAVLKEVLKEEKNIKLFLLKDKYPVGWEKHIVERVTKKTYAALPREIGVVVNNVQTAIAVCEAVEENKPLIEKVITITGEGIKEPKNLRIKIGTKFSALLEHCGGYVDGLEEAFVIAGGPMSGTSMSTDDFVISANLNAVVVLLKSESVKTLNCIGCGKCAEICPVKLTPTLIKQAYEKENLRTLTALKADKCVKCGLCSYICPSRVDVTDTCGLAKEFLLSNKDIRIDAKK
ncbi:MAG: RnfABCDGE type electron transport complex subunit C [Bacilli bacterium]|nr:RnfABCDGE type electron transport complex subunit C [Bacilli bacterium]